MLQLNTKQDVLQCSFRRHVSDLFWLARVLTGDEEAALRCLKQSIASVDCSQGVFPHFMNAWSRRTVINAACSCCSGALQEAAVQFSAQKGTRPFWKSQLHLRVLESAIDGGQLQEALASLDIFLRFVWVLRLGEGYTETETAHFLQINATVLRKALGSAATALTSAIGRPATKKRTLLQMV